ncbi:DinB family protein [Pedobacter endophyticus]|uniref:DinB family protein n=1 Tax=Pedobacter endophyticus TaxID=2789740 RepID=A0A7U3Q4H6_9SPHI|nr:DinB family protein [Pedobacter endophyticus]QPH38159.1 DinB family protein [Pedobacter endophyticus]
MSAAKIKASIGKIVNAYKTKLALYPDDSFQLTPPINGWSYSEVYSHIFDSSVLSTIAMENCIKGNGQNIPTHFVVKVILFFGAFPPAAKYKVPKRLADRVEKISRAEAHKLIVSFEEALESAYATIGKADKNCKTKHPRLGYLNAIQWLRFIEIHLKHHLKQLARIEKSFKV